MRYYKQQSGRYVNILYSSLNLHSADKNRLVYLTYDQYVVCPLEESDISVTSERTAKHRQGNQTGFTSQSLLVEEAETRAKADRGKLVLNWNFLKA